MKANAACATKTQGESIEEIPWSSIARSTSSGSLSTSSHALRLRSGWQN